MAGYPHGRLMLIYDADTAERLERDNVGKIYRLEQDVAMAEDANRVSYADKLTAYTIYTGNVPTPDTYTPLWELLATRPRSWLPSGYSVFYAINALKAVGDDLHELSIFRNPSGVSVVRDYFLGLDEEIKRYRAERAVMELTS